MQVEDVVLFLSMKPKFAESILSGTKTVELRRVPPAVQGRLRPLRRSAALRPRSASINTVESSSSRAMSTRPARVALPLFSYPSSRIIVPFVPAVGNGTQRSFNIVPPLLVIQATSDQCGYEGATAARPGPAIQVGHQVIVQAYVYTHVRYHTHKRHAP